jgi:hypothetical protein
MKLNAMGNNKRQADMAIPLLYLDFSKILFSTLIAFWLITPLPNQALAANERLGKTILARGSITADRNGEAKSLKRLSPVFRQDILRSGVGARAQFRMIDNALINLQQNSVLRLYKYQLKSDGNGSVLMELISGGLRTITGTFGKKNKKDYQLKTPVATIGIRGTMYEVEIMPNGGMYVGAWKGAIWIRSHSGKCNIELGDGFKDRFIFINVQGSCQVLKQIPSVFRDGHSSKTSSNTIPGDFTVEPLLENPRQKQDFQALILGQRSVAISNGRTNTISRATPIISTDSNGVVSSNKGAVTNFSQNIGGYPVGWGRWNNYTIRPTLDGLPISVSDKNGLLWSTYKATNIDVVANRIGEVGYDHMVDSLAQSNMGKVSNLAVQMNVDFGSGQVSKGIISANVPDHTWIGIFDGQVSNGKLTLDLNGGSLVNSNTGIESNIGGNIAGDFIGDKAQAITGGFNMVDKANSNNQIEGLFLID